MVKSTHMAGPTHEDFMRQAIAAAQQSQQNGGVAIGAVLVKHSTGRVITSGGSNVGPTNDPTAHAEINCIRQACTLLSTDDLFEYTLYSTLEPCRMCLGCAVWARLPRIYFGAYRSDVDASLFDTIGTPGDEQEAAHMNLREATTMHIQGGILQSECARLLTGYRDSPRHSTTA